jgi:hypothetical protein
MIFLRPQGNGDAENTLDVISLLQQTWDFSGSEFGDFYSDLGL